MTVEPHWLHGHLRDLHAGLDSLDRQGDRIESWGLRLASHLVGGGRLLTAGNGGSAAEAQHFTAEIVGKFDQDRRPLSAICLSAETSSLTAIVNDYGADEVFSRQAAAHGRVGDVMMLFSTSGRSPNILRAARAGHDLGLRVWAMTGRLPNPLACHADEYVAVGASSTAAVQEAHLTAIHAVCAALDDAIGCGSSRSTSTAAPARAGSFARGADG